VRGGGGQWRYVIIKFYISKSFISIQFVLRSIQVTMNAFTVYERKIWPSIISLPFATMRQYRKVLML